MPAQRRVRHTQIVRSSGSDAVRSDDLRHDGEPQRVQQLRDHPLPRVDAHAAAPIASARSCSQNCRRCRCAGGARRGGNRRRCSRRVRTPTAVSHAALSHAVSSSAQQHPVAVGAEAARHPCEVPTARRMAPAHSELGLQHHLAHPERFGVPVEAEQPPVDLLVQTRLHAHTRRQATRTRGASCAALSPHRPASIVVRRHAEASTWRRSTGWSTNCVVPTGTAWPGRAPGSPGTADTCCGWRSDALCAGVGPRCGGR